MPSEISAQNSTGSQSITAGQSLRHPARGRRRPSPDTSGDEPADAVLGRLVERGLHDELKGSAYALAQFFGADNDTNNTPVDRRLSLMSRSKLQELDRDLRIVNETIALQARFHLAVTPVLPAADQRAACVLGS